jgi:hypothetical protein
MNDDPLSLKQYFKSTNNEGKKTRKKRGTLVVKRKTSKVSSKKMNDLAL